MPRKRHKRPPKRQGKASSTKVVREDVWASNQWVVRRGELLRGVGRPHHVERLFRVVAEKLPYDALDAVRKHVRGNRLPETGVYVAHDSMGVARYIGRGNIFYRLRQHQKSHVLELSYFSFFVVKEKTHEREIETLLIRAAGPQLQFNTRKKRVDIMPGNVRDYEPGTLFYERQYKRGRKPRQATERRRSGAGAARR